MPLPKICSSSSFKFGYHLILEPESIHRHPSPPAALLPEPYLPTVEHNLRPPCPSLDFLKNIFPVNLKEPKRSHKDKECD